jgi:hypothetical protein
MKNLGVSSQVLTHKKEHTRIVVEFDTVRAASKRLCSHAEVCQLQYISSDVRIAPQGLLPEKRQPAIASFRVKIGGHDRRRSSSLSSVVDLVCFARLFSVVPVTL